MGNITDFTDVQISLARQTNKNEEKNKNKKKMHRKKKLLKMKKKDKKEWRKRRWRRSEEEEEETRITTANPLQGENIEKVLTSLQGDHFRSPYLPYPLKTKEKKRNIRDREIGRVKKSAYLWNVIDVRFLHCTKKNECVF